MARDAWSGRRVLVTGAASGIGEAIATRAAARGGRVILCDIDGDGLTRVGDALGPATLAREVVDVADATAMAALADRVHADHGPLDVLVNNAGVAMAGPLLEADLDDCAWLMGINVMGVVHGCRLFGPAMVEAPGRGHIVNVASSAGFGGVPVLAAYAASKAAVLSLSESLRAEIDGEALGITCVCPGFTPTGIGESARYTDERLRAMSHKVFSRKGRSADSVARAVIDAVDRDRFLVVMHAEAWAALWMRRLPTGLRRRLLPLLRRSQERLAGG